MQYNISILAWPRYDRFQAGSVRPNSSEPFRRGVMFGENVRSVERNSICLGMPTPAIQRFPLAPATAIRRASNGRTVIERPGSTDCGGDSS